MQEHAAEVERQKQAEKLKKEAEVKRQKELEEKRVMEEQQRIREGLARQAAGQGFERIKKSGSIIEVRRKQGQQLQDPDPPVQKSKSVKDLASAFLDQSCNLVPHSVAEINRKSLTMSSDCLAGFTSTDNSEVDARMSASPNVPTR